MSERVFVIGHLSTLKARFRAAYAVAETMVNAGRDVELVVRERKSKRSAEQNKRYWALLREVSACAWIGGRQYADATWHEQFKRQFIGREEVAMPDGSVVVRGISTTTLNVGQMTDYMQKIEHWCVEQGWPVMEAANG